MSWQDPKTWQVLKDGTECPMCADAHVEENEYSFKVTDLSASVVRLPRNQFHRGWTVVILRRHACELYELTPTELSGFWGDVAIVAKALSAIYQPVKLNYCVFGHHVPHVHCHLLLRFSEDDPHAPVDLQDGEQLLSAEEYKSMVAELREAMSATA